MWYSDSVEKIWQMLLAPVSFSNPLITFKYPYVLYGIPIYFKVDIKKKPGLKFSKALAILKQVIKWVSCVIYCLKSS